MALVDVLGRITPQMAAVLERQRELDPGTATDLEGQRAAYRRERAWWNEGGPTMATSTDCAVPTPYGNVLVRVHRPTTAPATGAPALIYLHGGGFVLGDLDTHDRIMRALADGAGCVVVGVDYALAPEAKFPRAIHEAAAVLTHLAADPAGHGIDGTRIGIAGDSGGAHLALATTLHLRETGGPAPDALLLYYGLFGLHDGATRRLYGGPWDGLTPADLDAYLAAYTRGPADLADPLVDLLSSDLSHGVPPCYVAAAGLDPLLDDSTTLAAILAEHGVPVRLSVFEDVLHAFLHHSRMLPEALAALAEGADFLRTHRPTAH